MKHLCRRRRFVSRPVALVFLLFCNLPVLTCVTAQEVGSTWQTLAPDGAEFRVRMPKDPVEDDEKAPYHRMTLNASLFTSRSLDGSAVILATLSGIKSNGAWSENERFNSYVDAFEKWLPGKLKDPQIRITFLQDIKFKGRKGREYNLVGSGMSGPVRCFLTRKKFYALAVMGAKRNDPLSAQYFESFSLPDPAPEPIAAQPTQLPGTGTGTGVTPQASMEAKVKAAEAPSETTDQQNSTHVDGGASETKEVRKGLLNGQATSLPQPEAPQGAANTNAAVVISVRVTVDEAGNVIQAHAIAGPDGYRQAAEAAALQAKFPPAQQRGHPVRVVGVLTYNFAPL